MICGSSVGLPSASTGWISRRDGRSPVVLGLASQVTVSLVEISGPRDVPVHNSMDAIDEETAIALSALARFGFGGVAAASAAAVSSFALAAQ